MTLYTAKGILTPQPPFDFQKSLGFIREFAPTRAEQHIGEQSMTKALYAQGELCGFDLKSIGTVDAPQLEYTLYAARPIDPPLAAAILDRITFAYSLYDDLRPFYDLGRRDQDFASVIEMLHGLHHVKFPSPFESACWAVLSQRVPMAVGHGIKQTLMERYGEKLTIGDAACWAFPEPDRLVGATQADLEAIVRNARKAEYLRAVIRAFHTVDESFLRTGDFDEVQRWLLNIKGIGAWSAELILWRGLGRSLQWNVTPDSISGQRMIGAAAKVYGHGQTLSAAQFSALAQRFGEWQGYWLYYLRTAD